MSNPSPHRSSSSSATVATATSTTTRGSRGEADLLPPSSSYRHHRSQPTPIPIPYSNVALFLFYIVWAVMACTSAVSGVSSTVTPEAFFFPSNCSTVTKVCCLEYEGSLCGSALGRGACKNIIDDGNVCDFHLKEHQEYQWWILDSFDTFCVCSGNYYGAACELCKPGWSGVNCSVVAPMIVRRNFNSLSQSERQYTIDAFGLAKSTPHPWQPHVSMFDFIASSHYWAMSFYRSVNYTNHEALRSWGMLAYGHQGPNAPTFHRRIVMEMENVLRMATNNYSYALPYWDWTNSQGNDNDPVLLMFGGDGDPRLNAIIEGTLQNCHTSPLDAVGNSAQAPPAGCECPVTRGPFAGWKLIAAWGEPRDDNLTIARSFGCQTTFAPTLPTSNTAGYIVTVMMYDQWFDPRLFKGAFRNLLGGGSQSDLVHTWPPNESDVTDMHKRVHRWVSGSMVGNHSASDPLFYLLHNYADLVLEQWIRNAINNNQLNANNSWPASGIAPGHNRYECTGPFFPLRKNFDMWVHSESLGFTYDVFNTTTDMLTRLIRQNENAQADRAEELASEYDEAVEANEEGIAAEAAALARDEFLADQAAAEARRKYMQSSEALADQHQAENNANQTSALTGAALGTVSSPDAEADEAPSKAGVPPGSPSTVSVVTPDDSVIYKTYIVTEPAPWILDGPDVNATYFNSLSSAELHPIPADTSFFLSDACFNRSCCLVSFGLECGGTTRGTCVAISGTVCDSTEHAEGLWWITDQMDHVCRCSGNWAGIACGECALGFSGADCTERSEVRVRRNFNSLSTNDMQYIISAFARAKVTPHSTRPSVSLFDYYASLYYFATIGAQDLVDELHPSYSVARAIKSSLTPSAASSAKASSPKTRHSSSHAHAHDKVLAEAGVKAAPTMNVRYSVGGPALVTWHRAFLLDFEREMGIMLKNATFALPYWAWDVSCGCNLDVALRWFGRDGSTTSVLGCRRAIKINGGMNIGCNCTIDETVGPFQNWSVVGPWAQRTGRTLSRAFSCMSDGLSLPVLATTNEVVAIHEFLSSDTNKAGFAASLQGVPLEETRATWPPTGVDMYDRLHKWFGGTMANHDLISSPASDPLFYLAHSYTDLISERWIRSHVDTTTEAGTAPDTKRLWPNTKLAMGHNREECMGGLFPLKRNADYLVRSSEFGYTYDRFAASEAVIAAATVVREAVAAAAAVGAASPPSPASASASPSQSASASASLLVENPSATDAHRARAHRRLRRRTATTIVS